MKSEIPITVLPPDVTQFVFRLVIGKNDSEDAHTIRAMALQVYYLSATCRQWKSTMDGRCSDILDLVKRGKLLSIQHRKLLVWNEPKVQVSTVFGQKAPEFLKKIAGNSLPTKTVTIKKIPQLSAFVNFLDTVKELKVREHITSTLVLYLINTQGSDRTYLDESYYEHYEQALEAYTGESQGEVCSDIGAEATQSDVEELQNHVEELQRHKNILKENADILQNYYQGVLNRKLDITAEDMAERILPRCLLHINSQLQQLQSEKRLKKELNIKVRFKKLSATANEIISEAKQIELKSSPSYVALFKKAKKLEAEIEETQEAVRKCKADFKSVNHSP